MYKSRRVMENKESKQIYAILGGVIACFICLAVVFLFPKGSSNLSKSNYNNLIPNNSGIVSNNSNVVRLVRMMAVSQVVQ